MIALKKLNGAEFVVNADLIETLESTPDTVIRLTTGRTLVALNNVEDIVRKIVKYKQLCHQTVSVVQRKEEINPVGIK